ncbi:mechanosensitive ion channel [Aestuariicella hydrocarbonica]|uniref:Small-conductance mechanosensitive channel n=1 Tax=Pseudomaricurvus hydrocarbonicus TaxID=1470433 RepID=A0A9E5JYE3_9GAMM|nr:mechanosensitive ion channel domain-containing protein [Aestuariicella hydrocarbonica]NHO66941.1 mechanosensitive ion channel [Aestuariicella hydrocarbonica]
MKFIIVAMLLIAYLVSLSFLTSAISRIGSRKSVNVYRVEYIRKTLKMGVTVFFVIVLFLLLGIEYSQLSVFLSSVFAVIGVALFAQWSILSNMTASLVIFFFFPYRVGDEVKVVDKDDDISGRIEEISLFHVMIRRNQELITYPNNLILQKAVIKNPQPVAANSETDLQNQPI